MLSFRLTRYYLVACAVLALAFLLVVAWLSATSTRYEGFTSLDVTEESVQQELKRVKNFTALYTPATPCKPDRKNSTDTPTPAADKCATVSDSVRLFANGSTSYEAFDTCIGKYLPIVERMLCDGKNLKKKVDAASSS